MDILFFQIATLKIRNCLIATLSYIKNLKLFSQRMEEIMMVQCTVCKYFLNEHWKSLSLKSKYENTKSHDVLVCDVLNCWGNCGKRHKGRRYLQTGSCNFRKCNYHHSSGRPIQEYIMTMKEKTSILKYRFTDHKTFIW